MTDNHQPLRDALKAGPTMGPWKKRKGFNDDIEIFRPDASIKRPYIALQICTIELEHEDAKANIAYLLAANPTAISAILADLDVAVKENERLREEMARDVMSKTMLTDVTIQNGSMGIQVEGGAAGLLANSFAEQFIDSGAENYLEVSFHHKKVGGLTVTLQRNSGKTPHMLRAKAECERDAAVGALDGLMQYINVFNTCGGWMDGSIHEDEIKAARAALSQIKAAGREQG
jgi:hypothetical protein